MDLMSIMPESNVLLDVNASSKRAIFQSLVDVLANETDVDPNLVLDLLLEREKLGTTGIGAGVAIPHAKIASLSGLLGFFIRASEPINFDALDGENVDLIFVLLAPEDAGAAHLKALAKIARVFRDENKRADLREATTRDAVCKLFADQESNRAA